MLGIVTAILVALVYALIVPMYRRLREKDEPVRLWGRDWSSTGEAAEALASATGLARERRREGSSWLISILMAPVWLLWGPMTAMRPERRLARWRLIGARTSGRLVRIELPAERVRFSLSCQAQAFFRASASRDGAPWPLEQQEGLRILYPVGGPRWQDVTRLIQEAFDLSLEHLMLNDVALHAEMALDERGPSPVEYPRILEVLEGIAICLEHLASDGTPGSDRATPRRE